MDSRVLSRRAALSGGVCAITLLARPGFAEPDDREGAIRRFTGGAATLGGRVTLDLPPLVENGNAAPLTVTVESPMSEADHVRRIAIFNERNPQPNVITASFGPPSGRATLTTRIRLATSQTITAVAEMSDGTYRSATADVIVTLAACVEG